MTITTTHPTTTPALSRRRILALRGGYLFMGLGLAVVKWPLLLDASTLPLFEGVVLSILTAMSLLALLGALRPVRMLPVLVLETLWKLIWLGLVALPRSLDGSLDAATREVLVNCLFVVVVVAVIPWRHAWRHCVREPGDPWREPGSAPAPARRAR